jgi:hypothetical protein
MFQYDINQFSEVEIYFLLETAIKKQSENPDDAKNKEIVGILRTHLSKYGVVTSEGEFSGDFNRWMFFWKSWKADLTIEELKNLIDKLKYGMDYQSYLPNKKWNE